MEGLHAVAVLELALLGQPILLEVAPQAEELVQGVFDVAGGAMLAGNEINAGFLQLAKLLLAGLEFGDEGAEALLLVLQGLVGVLSQHGVVLLGDPVL